MKHSFCLILLVCLTATTAFAQTNPQSRTLIHPTVYVSEKWFLTGWLVGNIQSREPDNINVMAGIGHRHRAGNIEIMFQQHWNTAGSQKLIDVRWNQQITKQWSTFVEVAPLIGEKAIYNFVSLERSLTPRLGAGIEMENVHKPGRDSIGGGPRASFLLKSWPHAKLIIAGSYQLRRGEPDTVRVYTVLQLPLRQK